MDLQRLISDIPGTPESDLQNCYESCAPFVLHTTWLEPQPD
jgi:hypothetical protein